MKKSIGKLVDELYQLKPKITELNRKVDELKAAKTKLEDQIVQALQDADMTGAKGDVASITIGDKIFPSVIDKEKFFQWAVEQARWECVKKDLNRAGVIAYLEETMESPPGVDYYTATKVKFLRKL